MADVVKKEIIHALRSLGIQNSDDVLVHSSMKSFGHVSGGSDTVIDAFLEVIGEEGTLIMPTLSQKNWETVYRDWHLDRPRTLVCSQKSSAKERVRSAAIRRHILWLRLVKELRHLPKDTPLSDHGSVLSAIMPFLPPLPGRRCTMPM